MLKKSKRDWTEDFGHENGHYVCRCVKCDNEFFGHKRRIVCKLCATQARDPRKTPRCGDIVSHGTALRWTVLAAIDQAVIYADLTSGIARTASLESWCRDTAGMKVELVSTVAKDEESPT